MTVVLMPRMQTSRAYEFIGSYRVYAIAIDGEAGDSLT